METITSKDNKQVKHVSALLKKGKLRRESQTFVVEGPRMLFETPVDDFEHVYVSESFLEDPLGYQDEYDALMAILGESKVDIVTDNVFSAMSDTKTPQGILAIVKMNPTDVAIKHDGAYIVLEDIQDPGNLGTIIRTAEAAGMDGIILSDACADIYSPKVVRATMGCLYRMPIMVCGDREEFMDTLEYLKTSGIELYAAALRDSVSYDFVDMKKACAVLIGNEGNGLTEESIAISCPIFIPMAGEVESLNAAVAASVLMYEIARQRRC